MSTSQRLITTLNEFHKSRYTKKPIKMFIKDNLESIIEHTTEQESKRIGVIMDIVSKPMLNATDRTRLIKVRKSVINVIKKYEEQFNEESNEDVLDENLSEDDIENLLDTKILSYNKFDETHPMKGITFNESAQTYKIRYDEIQTNTKNRAIACNKFKKIFEEKNQYFFIINVPKKSFIYKDHYFITYWHQNEPYFDIQHIISVLNLQPSYLRAKYNEFSDKICYHVWHKNQFDGYILRELINEKTMYQLILSSNSIFSKKFKNDVSDILTKLRQENQLTITNNKLTLKKFKNNEHNNASILKQQNNIHPCSYDSDEDMIYVRHLLDNGHNTALCKYLNKNVLYAFILPLKLDHQYIIIKFGFTDDIIGRFKTLISEYGCEIFFIGIKLVNTHKEERKFHAMLKQKYPEYVQEYTIKGKEKTELYKLSTCLMNEFNNYNVIVDEEETYDEDYEYSEEEQEIIDLLKQQEVIFLDFVNKRIGGDKSRYDYLIMKEKNLHDKIMKDKEIEMIKVQSECDIKLKEKEIELTKLRLKLKKQDKELIQNKIEWKKMENYLSEH